jgi:hypothetical protein
MIPSKFIIMKRKVTEIKFEAVIAILLAFIMISSTNSANIVVHALEALPNTMIQAKKAPANNTSSPLSAPSQLSTPSKFHGIKITSPVKGQQVAIGNNLVVSGASIDNSNSNCQVSVIANSIKPYQPATASGPGGANDYSKWTFTLSPKYTAIKEGENKITAKYSCSNDPSLVSFYSVNVTGIAAVKQSATSTTPSTPTTSHAAPTPSTPTTSHAAPTPSTPTTSHAIAPSTTPSTPTTSHAIAPSTPTTSHAIAPSTTPSTPTTSHAIAPSTTPSTPTTSHAIAPSTTPSTPTTSNKATTPTTSTAKIDGIKITSPVKGQQVAIGNNLVVSGASIDNSNSNCQVSVNLNHVKPNQPALASGPSGSNDYSQWTVTLPPSYAFLNAGENKITAKYSCSNDPSVTAFDSVNVTGLVTPATIPLSSTDVSTTTDTIPNHLSSSDNPHLTDNHDAKHNGNIELTNADNNHKTIHNDNIKSKGHQNNDANNHSNGLADNIIKDVERKSKEVIASADSEGATAIAGSASAHAGYDGISVSAGGITLKLP